MSILQYKSRFHAAKYFREMKFFQRPSFWRYTGRRLSHSPSIYEEVDLTKLSGLNAGHLHRQLVFILNERAKDTRRVSAVQGRGVKLAVGPDYLPLSNSEGFRNILREIQAGGFKVEWRVSNYYSWWKLKQEVAIGDYVLDCNVSEVEDLMELQTETNIRNSASLEELRNLLHDVVGPKATRLEWKAILENGPGSFERRTMNRMIRFKADVVNIPNEDVIRALDRVLDPGKHLFLEEALRDYVIASLLDCGLLILTPTTHECVQASPFVRKRLKEYSDSLKRTRSFRVRIKSIFSVI